jgi:folate-binding protein YgfZ
MSTNIEDARIEDEYRALCESCAVVDRSEAGRLELLGKDRQRFINAYLTCDVKGLTPGGGAYGFVTSHQGRILSDVVVLAHEDRLWLELGPDQEEPIAEHLKKFILADRVEIRPLGDLLPLSLIGPRSAEILGAAAADLPEGAWSHGRRMVLGTEVTVQRGGPSVPWAYTLWVSASIAPHLIESLAEAGVVEAGSEALEILRTEKGLPRFGRDYGAENFPQETGLEEAVSYTKGCYLGQEVVARIHYRGGVQKSLRGLVFEGEPPAPGAALLVEGRESGTVTTIVRSPALGGRDVGLAILHRRASAPGTRLEVAGGGMAEVRELPLAP